METRNTRIYNSTGKLKRILLGKPTYHAVIPVSDVARDLMDGGFDHTMADKISQHKEFEDVFHQLDIEVCWVEVEPEKLPWQMFTRDFGVNTPDGALVGRFRYLERKGEEIAAKRSGKWAKRYCKQSPGVP
jgi:N-dimethylarginine dimethylaminohydrolase